MKRVLLAFLILIFGLSGCAVNKAPQMTEQEAETQISDLFNGIYAGDAKVIKKHTGFSGPVVEQNAVRLKGCVKLKEVRDVSIQGTKVRAAVRVEVIPLQIEKDILLTFEGRETLVLTNPFQLLQYINS